ncbi:putative membrane protein [Burkholderia cenocepacia]|nr:putative membrane protein [Burkholderia cenocepacia]
MKHPAFIKAPILIFRFILGYLIFMGVYSSIEKLTHFHVDHILLIVIVIITTILELFYFTYYKKIGKKL